MFFEESREKCSTLFGSAVLCTSARARPVEFYWMIRGFRKIRGTFLAVPMKRITVYWGLYRVPPIFGKLPHMCST